jgi:hypothetical protein
VYLIVDAAWAKKHPRQAAQIQLACLLRHAKTQKADGSEKGRKSKAGK